MGIIESLGLIFQYLAALFGVIGRSASQRMAYPNLFIRLLRSLNHRSEATVKLAYAGSAHLVIESMELRSRLRLPSLTDKITARVQLGFG